MKIWQDRAEDLAAAVSAEAVALAEDLAEAALAEAVALAVAEAFTEDRRIITIIIMAAGAFSDRGTTTAAITAADASAA